MQVLSVTDLTKDYGKIHAVGGVSFTIEAGEIFGMIGPNGAGKTTTIECCLGLRAASSGEIRLLDRDPRRDRSELFTEVGVQLQEASYQEHIRVDEICRVISSLYENPRDWRDILERFGLAGREKAKVTKLSGGQRQRLTIALAMIPGPKIVFLDELTTGLDPRARREMWEDIRTLRNDGTTVFMTTHYMEEAEYLCDRVAVIDGGKLLALDTVDALLDNTDLDHEISLRVSGVADAELVSLPGVRRVGADEGRTILYCDSQHVLAALVQLLESRNADYSDVRTKSPGLEEVFLHLTERESAEPALAEVQS